MWKQVLVGVLLLFVVFFMYQFVQKETQQEGMKTEEKEKAVIEQEKEEIVGMIELIDLLEKADFCSERWKEEAKGVVLEIEGWAEEKEKSGDKQKGQLFYQIATDLSKLIQQQSSENIDDLEKSIQEFETHYGGKKND